MNFIEDIHDTVERKQSFKKVILALNDRLINLLEQCGVTELHSCFAEDYLKFLSFLKTYDLYNLFYQDGPLFDEFEFFHKQLYISVDCDNCTIQFILRLEEEYFEEDLNFYKNVMQVIRRYKFIDMLKRGD